MQETTEQGHQSHNADDASFLKKWGSSIAMLGFAVLFAGFGTYLLFRISAQTNVAPATPADTGAALCNGGADSSILQGGPTTKPSGSVPVPAGDFNTQFPSLNANTTYWFEPGTHTLTDDEFGQIIPDNGDTFIGAPGAILNGEGVNISAFTQPASNVTIEYLTIENFVGHQDEFIVNHDSGNGWIISKNTIGPNEDGAGLGVGDNEQITYNCFIQNGQYGINGYNAQTLGGQTTGIVIDHNEFDDNDTMNYDDPGYAGDPNDCGCAGGMKLWEESGTQVTDNYIHDNHDPGIWADTDNDGINIEDNYISNNWAEGVMYEISYNMNLQYNNFVNNAWVKGTRGGAEVAAVFVSNSGYDSRVDGGNGFTQQTIANNVFTNNWGGVELWDDSDRYCSNGEGTTVCTLIAPNQVTVAACGAGSVPSPYTMMDCRWRTQNTQVYDNTFNMTPSAITGTGIAACTEANLCGFNSIDSEYAVAPASTYWPMDTIPEDVNLSQNNDFYDNTYNGTWNFDAGEEHYSGPWLTFSQWQQKYTNLGQWPYFYDSGQDAGSTYNGTTGGGGTPPTVSLTSPTNNSTVSGTSVDLAATATDSGGNTVSSVQFSVAGSAVDTDQSSPYSYNWNSTTVANGTYTVTALATNNVGQTATSSSSITVDNVTTPPPPTVTITSPNNGSTVSGTVPITASVTAAAGVKSVNFEVDGSSVGSPLTSSPYTYKWDSTSVSNGSHTITAAVTDDDNQTTEANISVTVSNGTVTNPSTPTGLTADVVNSDKVELNWKASTPGTGATIAGYYVVINGKTFAEATGTGTTYTYNQALPNTTYKFQVMATDSNGNTSGLSNAKSVTTPKRADSLSPSAPTLSDNVVSSDQVNLTWTPSKPAASDLGISGYLIYRRIGNNNSYQRVLTVAGSVTSASIINNMTSATHYQFYVIAQDTDYNLSNESNVVTALTFPSSGESIIHGRVTTGTNSANPVGGATVAVRYASAEHTFTSGPDGFYLIPNIPPNTYNVGYSAKGYTSQTQSVKAAANQTVSENVNLVKD